MTRRTTLLVGGMIASHLILLAGCGGSPTEQAEGGSPTSEVSTQAPPPLPADVEAVAGIADNSAAPPAPPDSPAGFPQDGRSESRGTLALTGEVVSPVHSELVPKQRGRVERVLVEVGDAVRRGSTLLALEKEYFHLAVQRAEAEAQRTNANLAEARRDLARKVELLEKESVAPAAHERSLAAFEAAEAAHAAAEATLALTRQQLADTELRSPIDGVVAERRVDVGEALDEGTVAFVVVQRAPLKLRFHLPERHLEQLQRGQTVHATFDPYPGESFEAKITTLGQTVDPEARTLLVEATLPNRDGRLRPGMFAKVTVELGHDR